MKLQGGAIWRSCGYAGAVGSPQCRAGAVVGVLKIGSNWAVKRLLWTSQSLCGGEGFGVKRVGLGRHSNGINRAVGLETFGGDAVSGANGALYGSELQGYAERVADCNCGRERRVEFLPFQVENYTVGYIHHRFAQQLRRFPEVFVIEGEGRSGGYADENAIEGCVTLTEGLSTPDKRTAAVGEVLKTLKGDGLIAGWRDEMYPVVQNHGDTPFFSMERAAVKSFGIRGYGVHINGYVTVGGEKHLWVAKRSASKSTYPGKWDHIAAGGQPVSLTCKENVIKECDEEAGIPRHLAEKAVAVGAVSYEEILEDYLIRDVLFCYDIELPVNFQPYNKDGEVESFVRLAVPEVVDIVRKTQQYKPNCAIVIIDFLFRHGYIMPEQKGFIHLLHSLRSGDLV